MTVYSAQSVAVVEQHHLSFAQIHEDTAEPAVELFQALGPEFFVQVNEVARVLRIKRMASRSKVGNLLSISVILAGENQTDVTLLVPDRHTVGERPLVTNPSRPQTQAIVDMRTRSVKWFMEQALDHRVE